MPTRVDAVRTVTTSNRLALGLLALAAVAWLGNVPLYGSAACQPESAAQAADSRVGRAAAILDEWDTPNAPGCAVGAIGDGRFVFKKSFGLASIEHQVPIDEKTVFDIASMSKQFTAMAILLLEAEGKLSLNTDVRNFLPELPEFAGRPPVTVRHLLDHTSGLRDYLGMLQFMGIDKEKDFLSSAEALQLIVGQAKISRAPGDRFSYTNAGYFLLGVIVERVSGLSLAEFALQRIFKPLGMHQTLYLDDLTTAIPRKARGYAPAPSRGFRLNEMNMPEVGPGGVQTSLDDLLLWERNFGSPIVGTAKVIKRLTSPTRLNDGSDNLYAAGLCVTEYRGLSVSEHAGAVQGFNANMMRFPDQQFTVFVLCNRKGINPIEVSQAIADVFLEEELLGVRRARWGGQYCAPADNPDSARLPAEVPKRSSTSLTGIYYQVHGNGAVVVRLEENRLSAALRTPSGQTSLELSPLSSVSFRVSGVPDVESVAFRPETPLMAPSLELRSVDGTVVRFVKVGLLSDVDKKNIAGHYYSSEIDTMYVVTADARALRIRQGGWPGRVVFRRLTRIAPDRFLRGGKTGVELRRDERGKIVGLTVFSERDIRLHFEKVSDAGAGKSGP